MKTFSDSEINEAIARAPKLIQDKVTDGADVAMVIAAIGREYGLHVDIVGAVAVLTRNLLLGLVNPSEFSASLIASGVSVPEAGTILDEINKKIFVPLREEMKKTSGEVTKAPLPEISTRGVIHGSVMPRPASVPPVTTGQRAMTPRPVMPTNAVAPATVPVPQVTPIMVARPPVPTAPQTPIGPAPLSKAIDVPLPLHDDAPLPPRSVLPNASQQAPRGVIMHPPLPTRQAPPPPNLPGVPPAFVDLHPPLPETPELVPPTLPPIPPRPAPPQPAPIAPAPPYSVDPYREPVE